MERPTCKTCPYASNGKSFDSDNGVSIKAFFCHRNPPEMIKPVRTVKTCFPLVGPDDFCGEHPDFDDYLHSLVIPEKKYEFSICPNCEGSGKVDSLPCILCDGHRVLNRSGLPIEAEVANANS